MATTLDYGLKKALKHLKAEARLNVLMALVLHTNTRNRCWPGMDLIAEMTGYELATVTKAKQWLLEHSAIRLIPYNKRMEEELGLPKRQHIYELTGYLWVEEKGAKLYLPYLYGNVSQNETSNVSKSESSTQWNQSISNSSKVNTEELFSAPAGTDDEPDPKSPSVDTSDSTQSKATVTDESLDQPKPTHSAAPRSPKSPTHPLRRQYADDGVSPNPFKAVIVGFWMGKAAEAVTHADIAGFTHQITGTDGCFGKGSGFEQLYDQAAFTPEQLQAAVNTWIKQNKDWEVGKRPRKTTLYGHIAPLLPTAPSAQPKRKRVETIFDPETGAPIGGREIED